MSADCIHWRQTRTIAGMVPQHTLIQFRHRFYDTVWVTAAHFVSASKESHYCTRLFWAMVSGLQCPIALWWGLRLENDPQSSTDTVVLEDVRKTNQPYWCGEALILLQVEQSIPPLNLVTDRAGFLSWGFASVNIFDLESFKEVIK